MTNSPFELDDQSLETYLKSSISGFNGPLSSKKFSGGQSNPTYLLSTPSQHYVLRRQPPGKLLKGAHAVDREYRVMSALKNTPVPVAEALHLCEDPKIIGSMFYIMEFKDGQVYWDPTLPDQSNAQRTAIYAEMNRVLTQLHSVDIDEVGLGDYGKRGEYFARQVHTWSKNYKASEIDPIKEMDSLIDWLPANLPEEDGKFSIVHGDFRLDNLMFEKEMPSVSAVLDWELSTIGHPYADLAYQCMLYYLPANSGMPGLGGVDTSSLGIPSETEYVDMYCKGMGYSDIPHWNFYLAFSMFRLASICQGVLKRAQLGNASSKKAGSYGDLVTPLASTALQLAHRRS